MMNNMTYMMKKMGIDCCDQGMMQKCQEMMENMKGQGFNIQEMCSLMASDSNDTGEEKE